MAETKLKAREAFTLEEATEVGLFGQEVDPTPDERYSQESSDWRTPETDPAVAAEVGSSRFAGAGEPQKTKSAAKSDAKKEG